MPPAEAVIGEHIRITGLRFEIVGVSSEDFLAILNETTQTFTLLLAGIASVSVLDGGSAS